MYCLFCRPPRLYTLCVREDAHLVPPFRPVSGRSSTTEVLEFLAVMRQSAFSDRQWAVKLAQRQASAKLDLSALVPLRPLVQLNRPDVAARPRQLAQAVSDASLKLVRRQ